MKSIKYKDKHINIIGGGISGLLVGYYLKKSGHKNFTLYEGTNRLGGKLKTEKNNFGIIERAANGIYTNDDVYELLDELKIPYISAAKKLKKKIINSKRKTVSPLSIGLLLRMILGIFKTPPRDTVKLTVFDFFKSWIGKKYAYQLVSAALGGVYASTSKELHFKSVFKVEKNFSSYLAFIKDLKEKRKHAKKSKTISFRNGLESLIDELKNQISQHIKYKKCEKLNKSDINIICTDAIEASEILKDIDLDIAKMLKQIEYKQLSSTTFFIENEIQELASSFGAVSTPESNLKLKGVLSNNSIFPQRLEKYHSYTVISADLERLDVFKEFCELYSLEKESILHYSEQSWVRALPVYNANRYNIMKNISQIISDKQYDIILMGNYVNGISIRELITQAKAII